MKPTWRTGLLALVCVTASCIAEDDSTLEVEPGAPVGLEPEPVREGHVSEMALDDDYLYWAVLGHVEDTSTIWRMSRSGGAPEVLVSVAQRAYAIALDQTHIYFTATDGQTRGGGFVARLPKAGGPTEVLVAGLPNPTSVALDADHVYYTVASSPHGAVYRVAKAGGSPALVVDGIDNPWDIDVSDDSLFVSAMNQSEVLRFPKTGGVKEVLASGTIPTWMHQHAGQVYFGSCTTGPCETSELRRVSVGGGPVTSLLSSAPGHEGKITSTSTFLVWGRWLLPFDGSPALDLIPDAPTDFYPMAVAADAHTVFIANERGTILTVPVTP